MRSSGLKDSAEHSPTQQKRAKLSAAYEKLQRKLINSVVVYRIEGLTDIKYSQKCKVCPIHGTM